MKWVREHMLLTSALGVLAALSISSIGYYLLTEKESEEEEEENQIKLFKKAA